MIIPSFSGFAATPNTGEAWLGGVASAQRDTAMAQQAAQANQQIEIEKQKLQQQAVQSQMELQAQQKAEQDRTLMAQQELQIKQQYDQNMAGLRKQQLDTAQQHVQMQVKQAADQFAARQTYTTRVQAGEDASKVALEMAPQMGLPSGAYSQLFKPPVPGGAHIPGSITEAQGGNGERVLWNNESHAQLLPSVMKEDLAKKRLDQQASTAESRQDHQIFTDITKAQQDDWAGQDAYNRRSKGQKLDPADEAAATEYADRKRILNSITQKITNKLSAGNDTAESAGEDKGTPDNGAGEVIHAINPTKFGGHTKAVFKGNKFLRYAD